MTWRVMERYGNLPLLVMHEESKRSIGWFDDAEEAQVVCDALNAHERKGQHGPALV